MSNPSEPLLTPRAFLVLLAALLAAAAAGILSYLAALNVPAAVLVGFGAFGVALPLLHNLLGRS
jgi:hypothetical protein